MSEQQKTTTLSKLVKKDDGLYYEGSSLNFRISGLTSYNLDRLKVTLKAAATDKPEVFHIDTFDMYNCRSRENYAVTCNKYLHVKINIATAELNDLISVLEDERVAMQKRDNSVNVPPMSDQDKKEALNTLKSSDLINTITADFDAIGLIGERHNKLLGYLASVSRLLPDPVGVLILSRSGAGKTSLQDSICKFVPPEHTIQYTRLTGQSLFYRDENALKNKVLAIEEEEGMLDAMYSIRTLQSSQKLSIATTRADAKTGKLSVDEYTVYGPVVVMISTTNPDALDPETRQRFLILTIDESEKQTKEILQMQRHRNTVTGHKFSLDESNITKIHHNMQRLLKPLTPIFPDKLEITYPYNRLQMRREQKKYLTLIKSITLLHQYQRETGTIERLDGTKVDYVLVDKEDVKLALELGRMVFHRNVDDVSPTGRTLLGHITTVVNDKVEAYRKNNPDESVMPSSIPFTRKELRDTVGWSEAQIRQNITPLVDLGYLSVLQGQRGSAFRYVMLDDGTKDPTLAL